MSNYPSNEDWKKLEKTLQFVPASEKAALQRKWAQNNAPYIQRLNEAEAAVPVEAIPKLAGYTDKEWKEIQDRARKERDEMERYERELQRQKDHRISKDPW